ncbi:unnamed protein product [Clavelina lepadiformis]|uniref:Glucocorticoid receptor n=1 Tax=Clavelina lepadiformis TaxID=159417 RepID=A0ABP0GCS1_CLALP
MDNFASNKNQQEVTIPIVNSSGISSPQMASTSVKRISIPVPQTEMDKINGNNYSGLARVAYKCGLLI